jgi:hypothetical protein
MTARYGVHPVPEGEGWVMVVDPDVPLPDAVAAMFRLEHREIAQEFADRLNVRELAERSRR